MNTVSAFSIVWLEQATVALYLVNIVNSVCAKSHAMLECMQIKYASTPSYCAQLFAQQLFGEAKDSKSGCFFQKAKHLAMCNTKQIAPTLRTMSLMWAHLGTRTRNRVCVCGRQVITGEGILRFRAHVDHVDWKKLITGTWPCQPTCGICR